MIEPVAVCAPVGRDGAVVLDILRAARIPCGLVDPAALVRAITDATYSSALLTEEALPMLQADEIDAALSRQPPWSDFHFLVLAARRRPSARLTAMLKLLGNVSQVERPVHPATLVRLVQTSIRARQRPLDARRYLEQRESAERALTEFADSLEHQVAQRTRALAATNKLLVAEVGERIAAQKRLNQMQAELIHVSRVSAMGTMASTLAHELNQPLTAVSNYLRASIRLLETGANVVDPDAMAGLESAASSAHRAGEIVRRLRELVSRGAVTRRMENLPRLIDEAVGVALVDAAILGVTYSLSLEPAASRVFVDRVQIQQVLINLLRNAVEAMGNSKRREITIASRCASARTVEISVLDTGPGLTPDTLKTLFSSFKSTKEEGMGVGLSICRTIVEANGGEIIGVNRPEGGAAFSFTVPIDEDVRD